MVLRTIFLIIGLLALGGGGYLMLSGGRIGDLMIDGTIEQQTEMLARGLFVDLGGFTMIAGCLFLVTWAILRAASGGKP